MGRVYNLTPAGLKVSHVSTINVEQLAFEFPPTSNDVSASAHLEYSSIMRKSKPCEILAVGKRRDGGTRFWCVAHRADATAKYGKRAHRCRYAHIAPIQSKEIFSLEPSKFPGGIAIWGAVPPVYDTTRLPIDRGIHVHARSEPNSKKKAVDHTFRQVKLKIAGDILEVSELDAIYYMVSSVFGYSVKYVECTFCRYPHLDKDWFSVHNHRRHLCAGCGRQFSDIEQGIGNPIARVRDSVPRPPTSKAAQRSLKISQKDFVGGIQIWGSNPAIVWTSKLAEEHGIHVHAFEADSDEPCVDDTFCRVEIDGVSIDPVGVRILMAQSALPHIQGRVVSLDCRKCGASRLDIGEAAFTANSSHLCEACGVPMKSSGRFRNVINNPTVALLERLSTNAPRAVQRHNLGLLPETI